MGLYGKHEKVSFVWAFARELCPGMTYYDIFPLLTMYRVACILYFLDLLLQSDVQGPSSEECPDFFDMPLPCIRELWQSVSDREWKKRYYEYIDIRIQRGRKGLTYRHLLSIRRATLHGNVSTITEATDAADEVAEWCEKADDLNMLLWVALTIEGAGQAPEISRM
jgi:hypothetical protein